MPAPDPRRSLPHPDDTDAVPRPGIGAWLQRRRPWLMLTIGLLASVTLLTLTQALPRVDRILQDNTRFALAHKASDKIVIVAIDDKSLAAIGRWPWRRAMHAELLRRIGAQEPRCIGLDLLLSENDPDHPVDDRILASAMLDAGCAVLPMALQTRGLKARQELLPMPLLADAASGIGHAHVSVDEDGVARSIYLREGFAGRQWPSFALALRDAADVAAGRMPPSADRLPDDPNQDDLSRPWLRRNHQLIVFAKRTMPFKTVSYVDVLRNTLPPDTFRDHYVLVGATAVGLGDAYATTAPDGAGLMPGVEIFANVLQGLLDDRRVTVAQPWQDLLFNLVPLAVVLLGLLWLQPLGVVVLIGAMLALQVGIHLARPWVGLQFAPASGFVGLVLVYPLWSLLRLNAAMRYLSWGAAQLTNDFGALSPPRPPRQVGDFLDRQMAATSAVARRVRDIHRFVRDGIDHLPDATLILDNLGLVRITNMAAQSHWQVQPEALLGRDAHTLLGDIRWRTTGTPMMPPGALIGSLQPIVGEGEDGSGRALLLRCVPFFDTDNGHAGWMASLVDITRMRQALAQRDEALRFISHDIREPSASILTTIELARAHPDSIDHATAIGRIERHARTGLELADGFVNLARAEAQPFRPELLDLVALGEQAIDDAWASAKKGKVRLRALEQPEEALFIGDRSLITRALANILSNAIKYSPPGAQVQCGLLEREGHWAITVQDQGPGIAPELQSQLFQPFHRLHRDSMPGVHGVGLGLLLVRTVAQRHQGTVEIESAEGLGSTVRLVLPKPTAAELEAISTDKQ